MDLNAYNWAAQLKVNSLRLNTSNMHTCKAVEKWSRLFSVECIKSTTFKNTILSFASLTWNLSVQLNEFEHIDEYKDHRAQIISKPLNFWVNSRLPHVSYKPTAEDV